VWVTLARQQSRWADEKHPLWKPAFCADARFFPTRQVVYNIVHSISNKEVCHSNDALSVLETASIIQKNPQTHTCLLQLASQERPGQPFLWLYQSKFMGYMCEKYGNTVTCLDATYKTNSYGLPLFQLLTVDNCLKGQIMGIFMTQNEETDSIVRALRAFRQANPGFNPNSIMMDKSSAEISACKSVFPEAIILICDFHWTQILLREITVAKMPSLISSEDCNRVVADLIQLGKVASTTLYTALKRKFCARSWYSKDLKKYLEDNWWPCEQMWASCYRQFYRRGVSTNNYLERMNRTVKMYQRQDKVGRLDKLMFCVATHVTSHMERSYQESNLKSYTKLASKSKSRDEHALRESFTDSVLRKEVRGSVLKARSASQTCID
jgi:hypothetical protein